MDGFGGAGSGGGPAPRIRAEGGEIRWFLYDAGTAEVRAMGAGDGIVGALELGPRAPRRTGHHPTGLRRRPQTLGSATGGLAFEVEHGVIPLGDEGMNNPG